MQMVSMEDEHGACTMGWLPSAGHARARGRTMPSFTACECTPAAGMAPAPNTRPPADLLWCGPRCASPGVTTEAAAGGADPSASAAPSSTKLVLVVGIALLDRGGPTHSTPPPGAARPATPGQGQRRAVGVPRRQGAHLEGTADCWAGRQRIMDHCGMNYGYWGACSLAAPRWETGDTLSWAWAGAMASA